jgi:signal transduction histidine kinase
VTTGASRIANQPSTAADWKRVVDAVESPILVLGDGLHVELTNHAFRVLVGKTEQELQAVPLRAVSSDEPWSAAASAAIAAGTSSAPVPVQVTDGSERTWDLLAMRFNAEDPGDRRVIVTAWDVTHATALQVEIDRRERMALLGSLVVGMAHEVRSPLFAISATIDALEQVIPKGHEEYFSVLREEVDRMSTLMHDLLEYGRPAPLQKERLPAERVARTAVASTRALASAKDVLVEIEDRSNGTQLVVDEDRIRRALENLISNAIHHSAPKSRVSVTVSGAERHGRRYVDFSVKDSGSGIRPADLPNLFDPFFSRRRGGTGLGLSIVQRSAEEHGGSVTAANREGGGAEFILRLPGDH